jgi:outer membrane immunogenic protein
MKRVLFASAVMLAASTSAFAADVAKPVAPTAAPAKVVPPLTWQGFYVGLNAGYGWEGVVVKDFDEVPGVFENHSQGGFAGGGQLGYNWQHGAWVFGPEVDLGWLGANATTAQPGTGGIIISRLNGGLMADVTGRVGLADGPVLIYFKGGYAYDGGTVRSIDTGESTASKTGLSGWTIAGGVELKHSTNWSVKLEYQYFNFGTTRSVLPSDGDRYDNSVTAQTIKIGLNYFFH